MRRYEDFSVVTCDALVYTLRTLGLKYDTKVFERSASRASFLLGCHCRKLNPASK